MAAKIKTEVKPTRYETYRLDPADIKKGRNSRMVPAANYKETVQARAVSIFKQGQLAPCEGARDKDGKVVLTFGFTRLDAVVLLRSGFDAIDPDTGETVHFVSPDLRVWINVVDASVDECFIRAWKENIERTDTTDLQEALAQQEIRTTMGWTNARIAREAGYTNQNRVSALEKLLCLPDDVQALVHEGKLALYPALDTKDLTPEDRAKVLEGSTGRDGKIGGAALRALIRELDEAREAARTAEVDPGTPIPEDDGEPAKPSTVVEESTSDSTPKKVKRTATELQNWLAEAGAREGLSKSGLDLIGTLSLWLRGERTTGTLWTKLFAAVGEE